MPLLGMEPQIIQLVAYSHIDYAVLSQLFRTVEKKLNAGTTEYGRQMPASLNVNNILAILFSLNCNLCVECGNFCNHSQVIEQL